MENAVSKKEVELSLRNTPAVVYCLVDPRDSKIRYVGHTSNAEYREKKHIEEGKNAPRTSKRVQWLNAVIAAGYHPIFAVLEETDKWNGPKREEYWINFLLEHGAELTNKHTTVWHTYIPILHYNNRKAKKQSAT